ncbi:MAG: AAA family ATPase [Candidatus Paceibacteria bacterium]
MSSYGTLIFFCGKMGAGKSTLSAKIAGERGGVLISEDEWLAALFPGEIKDFNDYISYSARLKPVLRSHVEQMLMAGTTVVLDFPGNTRKQRAWFKSIYSQYGIPHELYYVAVDDEVCLKQLKQRQKERPERARFDTEEGRFQV